MSSPTDELLTYTRRTLDRQLFYVQQTLSSDVFFDKDTTKLEAHLQMTSADLIIRLHTMLFGDKKRAPLVPATWWDHMKHHFASWMPMWSTEPKWVEVDLFRLYPDIAPVPGQRYYDVLTQTNGQFWKGNYSLDSDYPK